MLIGRRSIPQPNRDNQGIGNPPFAAISKGSNVSASRSRCSVFGVFMRRDLTLRNLIILLARRPRHLRVIVLHTWSVSHRTLSPRRMHGRLSPDSTDLKVQGYEVQRSKGSELVKLISTSCPDPLHTLHIHMTLYIPRLVWIWICTIEVLHAMATRDRPDHQCGD